LLSRDSSRASSENIFTDQGFSSSLGSAQAFSTRIIPVTFGVYF